MKERQAGDSHFSPACLYTKEYCVSINRRGILRLLPGVPAAIKAAQKQAEDLVGASVADPARDLMDMDYEDHLISRRGSKLVKFLKSIGIPDWKKKEIRRYARRSRRLDPDIAALRSISLSAKLNMQWRRNEIQQSERLLPSILEAEERNAWLKNNESDYF